MRQLSRWLIVLLLFLSIAFVASPAHAGVVTITAVDWTSTTAPMGGVVTNHIRVAYTGVGLPAIAHVTLSLSGWAADSWWATFSQSVVDVALGGSVVVTLTIPLPGPADICPGQTTPGPYYVRLTVQGRETTLGTITGPTLTISLLPTMPAPLTVNVEPSKPSYIIGETVTLKMDSNLRAEYYLKVKKPDGSEWATAQGYLPASFTKQAGEPLGTYTAELTAYYCGVAQDVASFTVGPNTYDVTIQLSGLPPDAMTALLVDGSKVADMKGGDVKVLSYPIGTTHTFQVDQYVKGATGYRYYCASNSWTASAVGSKAFSYATQVYLDVAAEPAGLTDVTPSGWYSLGQQASISSVPTEIAGSAGVKHAFKDWTVDGTSRAGNGFVLIMDAPHKVVARFDTLYRLTVMSDYGNPQGDKYYKAGETATFSVESPVGLLIQQVFVEWTGDYHGKESKGSLIMDGPKTVTAVWTTSYFRIYLIAGAIAAIIAIIALIAFARSRRQPSTIKPPPPLAPSPAELPESEKEPSAPSPSPKITKRCTNCGHELGEKEVYCRECGQRQTD